MGGERKVLGDAALAKRFQAGKSSKRGQGEKGVSSALGRGQPQRNDRKDLGSGRET